MRGDNEARILARCRREGEHLVWTGGQSKAAFQFLMSDGTYRRTRPAQAYLLLQMGADRLPAGMAVVRTCDHPACILHAELMTAVDGVRTWAVRHGKLTDDEVRWLRAQPRTFNRLPPDERRAAFDQLMDHIGWKVKRKTVMAIRTPKSSHRRHARH